MGQDVRAVSREHGAQHHAVMDPVGTLLIAISALVVLDLAAPHLAGDGRVRRRAPRRTLARR